MDVRYRTKEQEERYTSHLHQPLEIGLETIALCNAACTFCPYPTLERKGEKMTDELLYKLIAEMSTFEVPFFFCPFKVNEPFLDKRFYDICRLVEMETMANFRIYTNGAALTQRRIDEIASLRTVAQLNVSLNSHIPEEYEMLMKMPFERTARRLDNLHNQDFPHRVFLSSHTLNRYEFKKYCYDRWPKFKSQVVNKTSWLGFLDMESEYIVPDKPCERWWELSIMSNGIVSLCCQDGEGKFPIGDVNKQTMLEVYNAPILREQREKMLSRRSVPVCKTCDYI